MQRGKKLQKQIRKKVSKMLKQSSKMSNKKVKQMSNILTHVEQGQKKVKGQKRSKVKKVFQKAKKRKKKDRTKVKQKKFKQTMWNTLVKTVGGSFSARVQGPQRSCNHILEDEVDGQKEEQGDQREESEWRCGGNQRDTQCAWTMKMGWHVNACGLKLEPMQCDIIWTRKNRKGTLTTEESTLTTKELQCMMPSCRLASELCAQIPKCFRSLHTLLGLSFCVPRYQFTCCQSIKVIHFNPVREFLVEIHTAKMDVWGAGVHTPRRLQKTLFSENRNN